MGADVFFLSAAAKLGATVVTYPLLLVKARLMSAGKETSQDRKYTGTVDAIERIYKTEGDHPRQAVSLLHEWQACRWLRVDVIDRCIGGGHRRPFWGTSDCDVAPMLHSIECLQLSMLGLMRALPCNPPTLD